MNSKLDSVGNARAHWQVPSMSVPMWEGKAHQYCVVIPVINEGKRIHNLLSRMQSIGVSQYADIIIVDGGSTDGSLELNDLAKFEVRGLVVKTGKGKLSSQLRCAYAFALDQGYEGIITIDGNDKDDPAAIPDFIQALDNGYDFVQASRFISGGIAENTPKSRDIAIRYIHAPALSLSSGFHWTDTTQGFRAYSRKMLLDERVNPFRDIFSEYELLAFLSHKVPQLGYKCCELPTVRRYPTGEVPTKITAFRGNLKVFQTLVLACCGYYNSRADVSKTPIYVLGLVGLIASLLAFFPGWMSPDSFAHYLDVQNKTYNDWQPVLFSWWWEKLDRIYAGPALMLIQNLLLYWGGWVLLAIAIRRQLGRFAPIMVLLGFWPGILFPLGQIWKDISFATAMFFAWALVFYVYMLGRRMKWYELGIVLCVSLFAYGVKTNGITALPFLFAFMTYVQLGKQWQWKNIVATTLICTGVCVLGVKLLVPEDRIIHTYPLQYTQTYDLLALSVKTQQNLLPDYITDKIGKDQETLESLYFLGGNNTLYYNTVGNITIVDPKGIADLNLRWRNALLAHPAAYMTHRWGNFLELLRWGGDYPAYIAVPEIPQTKYGFVFSENKFSNVLSRLPIQYPQMFFPWIYLAALALSVVVILLLARQYVVPVICIVGSVLGFVFPHIFVAPAADYRYLYYTYFYSLALVFIAAVILCQWLCNRALAKSKRNINE